VAKNEGPKVIVRRAKGHGEGHHGGAWKIAYADFVTAMMAFFLLMWLMGTLDKPTREGIAEYFKTPIEQAISGGPGVGQSDSILDGGGNDLTRDEGQAKKADMATPVVDLKASKAEEQRQELEKLEKLKKDVEDAINANPNLAQFKKQIALDMTQEGLRIQIMDQSQRAMFASGSARLAPYTNEILKEIGRVLNNVPNRLSISGHTDATAYSGGEAGYSNWELSADRGNAARRELVTGGMDQGRILRVVGLADAVPFDRNDPMDPLNRRISIIVLNRRTEEQIMNGGTLPSAPVADAIRAGDAGPLLQKP
jgi:chemotaxis protein MotB